MTIIKISQVDIILSCVKHSESIWLICNNKETKKLILCSFNHYIDRICKQGVINDYYFSLIEETLYILTLRTTIKTATSHMPHLCLLSSTGLCSFPMDGWMDWMAMMGLPLLPSKYIYH